MESILNDKQTYGVETILNRIIPEGYIRFGYELRENHDDFMISQKLNDKFVST